MVGRIYHVGLTVSDLDKDRDGLTSGVSVVLPRAWPSSQVGKG